jgi:hypothetical protein
MKLDDLLDIAEKEIEQPRLCLLSVMGNLVALSAEAEEISQKLDKDSRLETLPEIRVAMQQSAARLDLAINRIDISLCDEEEG